MSFEIETSEDISSGGNFLAAPGTYHFAITQVLEGQYSNGKICDGFTVGMDVLDGTVRGQDKKCSEVGKVINLTFHNGKLTDKNQGAYSRKKQTAFLVASNIINLGQLGQKVTVDLQKAFGQQVIASVETDEENPKFLRLSFTDIHHVDDPRVAGIPKNEKAVELLPKTCRHDAKYFEPLMKKKESGAGGSAGSSHSGGNGNGGGGNGSGSSASNQTQQKQASFDDL